jgi:hypothetical protein
VELMCALGLVNSRLVTNKLVFRLQSAQMVDLISLSWKMKKKKILEQGGKNTISFYYDS